MEKDLIFFWNSKCFLYEFSIEFLFFLFLKQSYVT